MNGIICTVSSSIFSTSKTLISIYGADDKFFYAEELSSNELTPKKIRIDKQQFNQWKPIFIDGGFLNKPLTKDSFCCFVWGFSSEFLLRRYNLEHMLPYGDWYIWSDPEYNGDNTIKLFKGNPTNFNGRSKGLHFIDNFCGPMVRIC